MSNIFTIIGNSWGFYRKQPVLNEVMFWLLTLPLAVMMIFSDWADKQPIFREISKNGIELGITDIRPVIMMIILNITLSIIILWGISCILIIGKRLIKSKAGRTRSSFAIVRKKGSYYVFTLFMTDILRACLIFLWMLLFIIPGIIYAIRTSFYRIIIVIENSGYRASLNRSKDIIKGHTWEALLYFAGLFLVIFIPPMTIVGILEQLTIIFDPRLVPAVLILYSALLSFAITIFTISVIILYGEFLNLPRITEVKA